MQKPRILLLVSLLAFLAAACSTTQAAPENGPGGPPAPPSPALEDPRSEIPGELFSLGFDAIRPIYKPEFEAAGAAPLQDDELVIGVALEGEARAYPVTVLRFREMVNDELAGIPILVTW